MRTAFYCMIKMLFKSCLVTLLLSNTIVANAQSPLQSAKRCWKTLAPLIGGLRQEHTVVSSGEIVYILGGYKQKTFEETTADVEAYDTKTDTWKKLAPAPIPLHHVNVAAVDGNIYILGGMGGQTFGGGPTGRSFRYDIAADKWTEVTPMPYGLGSAAVGVHGKTVYLAGGIQAAPKSSAKGFGSSQKIVDIVASYNTETDKWTTHPDLSLPEARDHAGGMVVDHVFYVVGGRVGTHLQNRNTVYAMNLTASAKKWVEMAPLPTARGGVAAAATGGKIYVFGGEGNPNSKNGTYPDVGIFDIAQNRSEVGTPMEYPRHGFGAAAVGDIIYLPGGGQKLGGGGFSDINDAYVPC
ncbi:galactose oxidase [Microthyrium microscopicum]|uniref:Galactose oxidase n=1 Tax=Microthyrium microscopicum TaxID=703497 RepID=A0A6A6U840_9PEZI|nr:galactose oxidase [Microthyrium microscopicum]